MDIETDFTEIFKPYSLSFMNGKGYEMTEEEIKFALEHKDEAFEIFRNAYNETFGSICIDENLVEIHSGGWSDNEHLICEFKSTEWWRQHLVLTITGGHYYFDTAGIGGKKEWSVIKKEA